MASGRLKKCWDTCKKVGIKYVPIIDMKSMMRTTKPKTPEDLRKKSLSFFDFVAFSNQNGGIRPQIITNSMIMIREMLNLTERREGIRSGGMETRMLGMLSMRVVAERMLVIV